MSLKTDFLSKILYAICETLECQLCGLFEYVNEEQRLFKVNILSLQYYVKYR